MKNPEEFSSIVDSTYWRIAVQDDEEAFRILFYQFFAPLCIFASNYIENRSICEDIVQDTFLRLWKNRKSQEINTSLRNFLISSVKNSCIDHLRRKEIHQKYIENQKEKFSFEKDTSSDIYTTTELEQILEAALAKLPQNIREVFEMNRFKGMTYNEIAEQKQLSAKTIEAYMTKALKLLRTELKDFLPLIYLFL